MLYRHSPISLVFILSITTLLNAVAWFWFNRPQPLSLSFNEPLPSVSFAPYRRGQSPLTQVYPSLEQIDADLRSLIGISHSVRTYSSREGLEEVPRLAAQYGLKVIQGAWLTVPYKTDGSPTFNDEEIARLIHVANIYPNTVTRVIVGNEVLLRGELNPEQLIRYIRQVKAAVKQPVTYADVWAFFLKYPEVVNELDFITIHILPYWEDEPVAIKKAAQHLVDIYQKIAQRFPDKPIFIGEIGWPTAGRTRGPAIPNQLNSAKFLRMVAYHAKKQGFDYNWVEAFDQPWKSVQEGTVGAHWGLLDESRQPKFSFSGPVIANPNWQNTLFGALFLGLIGSLWKLRRRRIESLPRAFLIALFAQILGSFIAINAAYVWHISYSFNQELWAALRITTHAFYGGVLLIAVATLLQRQKLFLFTAHLGQIFATLYVLAAIYMTSMLFLDGRYRDIPVLEFLIPSLGLVIYALIHGLAGNGLSIARLFPNSIVLIPEKRAAIGLFIAAMIAPLSELWALAHGDDFITLHPDWKERIPLLIQALWNNTEMLIWSAMLILMALPFLAQWWIHSKVSRPS